MATKSPTITIRHVDGGRLEFKVGEAAAQLHTKISHAPLWVEDLTLWATVVMVLGVTCLALTAYCTAAVDAGAWPLVMMQAFFVVVGVVWWLVGRWRAARWLRWTLYGTVGLLVFSAGAVLLWLVAFQRVRDESNWVWWALLAAQLVETLAVICAAMSLANIYGARLVSDLNINMHRAVATQAKKHAELSSAPTSGVGSGATAMAAADDKMKASKKPTTPVVDRASKTK